jgi:hypothetical protein
MMKAAIVTVVFGSIIFMGWWTWTRSMVIRRYRVRRLIAQMREALGQYLRNQISQDEAASRLGKLLVANQRLPTDLEGPPEDFWDLAPSDYQKDPRIGEIQGRAAEVYEQLRSRASAA